MGGGGKLFCALVMERGGPEKPRKAVTLKWFFSSQPECDLLLLLLFWRELGVGASWDFPPR